MTLLALDEIAKAHEFQLPPVGWFYEGPDPSAGISTGGWLHESCPIDEPYSESQAISTFLGYEGEGYNRTAVMRWDLYCPDCGKNAVTYTWDWAPYIPDYIPDRWEFFS